MVYLTTNKQECTIKAKDEDVAILIFRVNE
jgi:hypothetical protein